MFWNRKKQAVHEHRVQEAVNSQHFADDVIAKIAAQEEEVTQVVTRLETRGRRNHFGEALELAMERRSQ